jgi:hypothetical protein
VGRDGLPWPTIPIPPIQWCGKKQKPAGAGFEKIPEGILLDSCFSSILVVCKYYKQFVGHVLQMHLNTVG